MSETQDSSRKTQENGLYGQDRRDGHHIYGPSSLPRRELCPGSARMEKDLPGFSTEQAAEGTRLHAEIAKAITEAIQTGKVPEIADETVSLMFHRFVEITFFGGEKVDVIQAGTTLNFDGVPVLVEYPLEFRYCGIVQYSGTADVLIVTNDRVIVIDWKTGRIQVEEAEKNIQTAGYALAAMQMFHLEKASVYIYNPVIGQDTHAEFADKAAIAKYIIGVIARCGSPEAALVPGEEQCRYCKAAYHGTCPALAKTAELTAVKAEEIVPIPALSVIPETELVEYKRKCDIIAKLAERVDAELKRRIEKNGSCGPWKLKELSGGKEITDIQEAFRLSGLPDAVFLAACTCSAAKLEKAYIRHRYGDFPTQKAAKADLAEKLGSVIQDKPRKKMLVKG